MKKLLLLVVLAFTLSKTNNAQITITPGGTTATLIANLFGPGVTVSGFTINCPALAYGTFTGSLGTSGMTTGGVVLTSGRAALADGPNTSGSAGFCNGTGGNAILAAAQPMPGGYFDACTIEFDIVPQCALLTINFCFGSEEYPEWVSSPYNDGFGIFCSGPNPVGGSYVNQNMATLPGGVVVSIDNVNAGVNPTYYNTNTSGIMQYDGYTDGLIGSLAVVPCASYHFVITVADAGDCVYDSGVFLQFQGLTCSTPPIVFTTAFTPTTCGGCNGTGTANVTGGIGPFTYSWTNAVGTVIGTSNSITGLCAGTYTVTVNDASLCTPPQTATVTIPASTPPVVTTTAETCAGYNNGIANINNAPGAGPYTVTITGPTTSTIIEANTAAASANFTGLPDGVYTYTVTGSGGCSFTGTFTINPGPPCCSVTAAGTPALCNGGSTGTATATPTGLASYSYSWTTAPVQITQTASGLAAGTYTVTMTDASGCVATASVTITQPTAITGSLTPVNPLCNGGSTGSITVTGAAGGTGALTYSLNGGAYQASNVFTGLTAGSYTINIKDANGCITTLTTTLVNPPLLTSALVSTTPATCGASNGAITVSGSGGTGALSYDLNPGPVNGTGVFTALAAGTYSVIVTDANGCTSTVSGITVGSSAGPTASILSQTNVSCFGGVNGSVLIGATGGTAPITYTIDLAGPTAPVGPQASNSFVNLTTGTYTVTVTDANGCTGTTTFTITSPTQLTYTSSFTPATCNGVCDGTITINPSGGTPGYQFSSNNGLTFGPANPMTGLCAGNIFVVVQDANGCLANSLVVMTQPAAITATFTPTNPICQGICNGQIAVTATAGGTPGYTYSINGGAFAAAPTTFTGLCSGANTVIIEDANGCQLTNVQNLVDPPGYTITVVDTQESHCGFNDGALEVVASGGAAPYSYNNVTIGVTQPTGLFTNLVAGGYDIEVTDANGCIEQLFVGVNDVEMDGILDGVTPATCFGDCDGTVQSHAINGAAPIQYELDLSGTFGVSGNFTGLCAGSHIITIVDNGFCIFTIPFTIVEPAAVTFNTAVVDVACSGGATGSITFNTVAGGNGVYTYSIDGGATYQASPIFTGLAAGTYTLSVMDGLGCLGSGTATIVQAPPLAYVANITDLTCFGNSSGFLQIVASGGTGAITYQANALAVMPNSVPYLGLPAGVYNVVVTDAAGCTFTGVETINEPTPLIAGYTITPTTCNGVCDGVIDVNASGATPAYQYSSDNGVTFQVSDLLTGLCDGSYQVIIKDANGCLIGSTQNVTEPTLVTFTTSTTNSTCGANNGTITFNPAAGGTPGYTYSIDNGATLVLGTNFTGLAAGTYPLVVEDANGCQVTGTATFINEASPVINALFTTDPLCFNDCNGTATITATGGTGTLQYSIDGGPLQLSNVFNAICSGAHTIDVVDANGCTDSQAINLLNPAAVSFTTATVDLTCFNDFSGSIAVTASGGTGIYTYSYDGGVSFTASSTNNSIAANTYNIEVQDGNNCSATGTATVNQPAQLVFTSTNVIDATCNGVCDGSISVVVSGGTVAGLYNYAWGGGIAGPTQSNATGVCVGTYALVVTDDNGCTINTNLVVNEPAPVIITSITVTDALCNGSCDGIAVVNCPAATQFSVVPVGNPAVFGASNTIGGLCTGTYDVSVTDAAGCPASTTTTINEPTALSMIVSPNSTICYASDFSLFALASGGTPGYSYDWDIASDVANQTVNPTALTSYNVVVTDANGCTFGPMTVTTDVIPLLTATVSPDDTICAGGSSVLFASASNGLAPYNFYWQAPANITADTITVTPATPTTYTVIAMDQCSDSVVLTVDVLFYTAPIINITVDQAAGCAPLNVVFTNSTGVISVSSLWDLGNGGTSTDNLTTSSVYNAAGCYDVNFQMTTTDGCVFDSTFNDIVCVYPDPIPDFTWQPVGPTILLPNVDFTNLSTNAVSYVWDFAGLDTSIIMHPSYNFNDVEAGDYLICLEATSAQGCIADTCKYLTLLDEFLVYVPNTFTPDGDGTNDVFLPSVKGMEDEEYEFMIFNRWGDVIFFSNNKEIGWDGTHNNQKSKEDVYVWKIKGRIKNSGDSREMRGHITLLR
jgi:large repetitive protein